MTLFLPLLLTLSPPAQAAGAAPAEGPTAAQMEQDIRDFERDYAEASALLAVIPRRREEVAGAPDLDALEAEEKAEFSRLSKLVDDLFMCRKRFRKNSNLLQVRALASQVSAGRADRARYDKAIAYRDASERMGAAFGRTFSAFPEGHKEFTAELARERRLRRKALLLRRAYAGGAAAAALLAAWLLFQRRRKPETPPRRDARHRPAGPARLE